jgi:hypothetical protein
MLYQRGRTLDCFAAARNDEEERGGRQGWCLEIVIARSVSDEAIQPKRKKSRQKRALSKRKDAGLLRWRSQ